jgi:hypothetical protein
MLMGGEVMGQTTVTYSTAGTYTWLCPPGVTSITVECWGGGGGGGGTKGINTSGQYTEGGGGAGGGYVKNTSLSVTPGTAYTIIVGSAGTAGAGGTTPSAGGKGGDSYFGSTSTVLAIGGNGGAARSTNGSAAGGAKVSTGNVGATAPFNYYGGAGGTGNGTNSGGGGGSAGTGSDGNDATDNTGGSAVTGGVAGRNGVGSNNNGLTGNAPGGGGSGGRSGNTSINYNGGAGGAGQVIVSINTPSCIPLFEQDFLNTTIANYSVANPLPNFGQFNEIASSSTAPSISSNKLRFNRSNGSGTHVFSRITDFSPTPTSLIVQFKLTVSGNSSASGGAAAFRIGDGMAADGGIATDAQSHSRLAISHQATAGQFKLRSGSTDGANTYSGEQSIFWVINNSGSTMTYRAPDGTNESIANDTWDVWVGTTKEFNDQAAITAAKNLTDIKFGFNLGTAVYDFDDLSIAPIPTIPTSSAASSITSSGFTANWGTVTCASGYRLDVSTASDFSSFVSGYNNLDVGNVTSYAVTGLEPSTQFYYRVRSYNAYTVGTFTSGNSTSQTATTDASSITVILGSNAPAVSNICSGTNRVVLQSFTLVPSGGDGNLTNVGFTTTGNYIEADISKYQLWYRATTNDISGATQLGIDLSSSGGAGARTFSAFESPTLTNGVTYYFWITADVSSSVSAQRTIAVNGLGTSDITSSVGKAGSTTNAGGTQTLYAAFTPGAIAVTGEFLCQAGSTPNPIGNINSSTGGDGNITYRWQSSTAADFSANLTTIESNTEGYTFTSGVSVTTFYRRQAKDGTCNTDWVTSTGVWAVTIATAPSTQASGLSFSSVGATGMTINWSGSGNGDGVIVVMKVGAAPTNPSNNTEYTASTAFGSGTDVGSNSFVVFNGSGSSVAVTGLSASTTYHVSIYSRNCSGASIKINTTAPLSGSQITLAPELAAHPAIFTASSTVGGQVDLTFSSASTIPNAFGYIILQRTGSNPTATPSDATSYDVGNAIGDGTVATIITDVSQITTTISGLEPSTAYHYSIIAFSYDGTNSGTYNYYTAASIKTANATTPAAANRYSIASGNWNQVGTWSNTSGGASCACTPASGDVIFIANHTITVTENTTASSIRFTGTSGTLSVNSGITLNVTSNITLNHPAGANNALVILAGLGTINTTSLNVGETTSPTLSEGSLQNTQIRSTVSALNISENINLRAGSGTSSRYRSPIFDLNSGTLTLGGTISPTGIAFGDVNIFFRMTQGDANGTLILNNSMPWATNSNLLRPWGNQTGAGYSVYNVSLNGTNSTVVYNGSGAQTILRTGNTTAVNVSHTNLILAGSGIKTLPSLTTTSVSGTLSMQGTATLTTTGTLTYGASSTLEYKGSSSQTTAAGEFLTGTGAPLNLIIDNPNGVTLHAARTLRTSGANTLTLVNGTLNNSTHNLTLSNGSNIIRSGGSLSAAPTFGTSVNITYNQHTGAITTGPEIPTSASVLNNLTVNNTHGAKAASAITVNGTLNLAATNPNDTDGILDMVVAFGNYAAAASANSTDANNNLNSQILTLESTATVTGSGEVTGKIRRTGFTSGITYAFGHPNMTLKLDANGGTLPTQITVVSTRGTKGLHVDKDGNGDIDDPLIGGAAVKRLWQVLRTGGTTPVRFTIRFPYDDSELNGNEEADLVTWDHHLNNPSYAGLTPHEHGKTNINTDQNFVELANHGLFYLNEEGDANRTKYWMLAEKVTENNLWLGAVGDASDNWNVPSNWTDGAIPDENSDIVIPANTVYATELDIVNANKTVGTIEIKPDGVFTMGSGEFTLKKAPPSEGNVAGTWVNQGTFNKGTGKVIFDVTGATYSGTTDFNNIEIKSGASLALQTGSVLRIGNTLTNNGTIEASSNDNTIVYNGTAAQTTAGLPATLKNLSIDNSLNVSMENSLTISSNLNLLNGNFIIGSNTLTLNGSYITGTPDNLKSISTSTINFNNTGTGNFNLPNFSDINTLNFNNNLTLTAVSNISVNGNLTINSGILDLQGFTANRASAGGTLTLGANGQLNIGGINTFPSNYNTNSIDVASTVNYNGENQEVAMLNSGQSYGNLTLSGTGIKTFAHPTGIKIQSNFEVDGTTVTAPDQLTFNGVAAQNIAGIAYNNVHFEGAGRKTFTSNASIKSDKAITFASGAGTIDFDGSSDDKVFTFKSDANGTARVGVIPVNGSGVASVTLEGKVKVERFIPRGKRAFRFLTPGVTTTNFIRANWQNNGVYTPGIGTHITGSSSASGFDVTSNGNPSMFYYENQVPSGTGWYQIPNTNATNLLAGMAYRILIRGDRTSSLITTASQPEMNVATTLSATGTLTTGRVTYNATTTPAINTTNNTTTNGFSLIGNPYVSPIDWHAVELNNIQNVYYTWEPNMGNNTQRGRYVAYAKITENTGETTVQGDGTSQVNRFIQPGQAFFVKTIGANPSITFNETHKASTFRNVFREAASYSKLNISVFESAELGIGGYALDGVVALYGEDFTNEIGTADVPKMEAAGENLAIFGHNLKWAMQGSSPVQDNDELLIKTLRFTASKNYTFKIKAINFDASVTAYLVDNFLGTTTAIDMTQDYFANFATTSAAASYGEDRFKIVFKNSTLGTPIFESNISLYPNPSTTNAFYLNVPNWTDDTTVRLHNAVGQEIPLAIESSNGTVRYCKSKIDLPVGMYIVTITQEGKIVNKKWLIQL